MKHLKFTKTNLTQLPHPTGKTPDRIFAQNCSGLCVRIQPQPSLVKSYYASFSKVIIKPNGTQKRTGRYKYICRVGDRPLEEVMAEVKTKIKEWKKENSQTSQSKTVGTLVEAYNKHVSGSYRIKTKGHKIKYKELTSDNYKKNVKNKKQVIFKHFNSSASGWTVL